VTADSLTGAGFTASGITLPLTIAAGQTATLNLQFDPTGAGAATSNLTITSNASTSPTTVVALSGTGVQMAVDLAWDAPAAGTDPVTGYNIYRETGTSSTYVKLNLAVNAPVSFADPTIVAGLTYDYYVTSVDSSGNESTPSNTATVVVP
jgi:fibronectin type 3 domain-containing protein